MEPKIIIEIKGGTVISTYTNRDMNIYIIDHDSLAQEDDPETINDFFDSPYAPDSILIKEDDFDGMLKEIREEFEGKEVKQ